MSRVAEFLRTFNWDDEPYPPSSYSYIPPSPSSTSNAHDAFFDFGYDVPITPQPVAPPPIPNPPPCPPVHNPYAAIPAAGRSCGTPQISYGAPAQYVPAAPPVILKAEYTKKKGMTSQQSRVIPTHLTEDSVPRETHQQTGKSCLWFFILELLNDPSKKSVIYWTGFRRYFKIANTSAFCRLWADHNGQVNASDWESIRRTLRSAAQKLTLMAVPDPAHKGRNLPGVFAFVMEPAQYLKMTVQQLDNFIRLHCEDGPLTKGYPIDTTCGFPVGTKLRVHPIQMLNNDGIPIDKQGDPLPPSPEIFITVIAQSSIATTPTSSPSDASTYQQPHPFPSPPQPLMNANFNVQPMQPKVANHNHAAHPGFTVNPYPTNFNYPTYSHNAHNLPPQHVPYPQYPVQNENARYKPY